MLRQRYKKKCDLQKQIALFLNFGYRSKSYTLFNIRQLHTVPLLLILALEQHTNEESKYAE